MRQVQVSQMLRCRGCYATSQFGLILLYLGIYHNLQPISLRVAFTT